MKNSPLRRLAPLAGKPLVRRGLIAFVVLVLLYAGLGFFALPAIIQSQAQRLAAEQLHRRLAIDKVELNPFTLALTLHGFKLMEPQGDAVFASFDTLALDLSAKSLLRLAPVVQEIRLSKPYLHLVRADAHRYNFDDLADLIASQPPSPQPARFSLNNIQVDGGRIAFEDRPAKTTHEVSELALGVPFVSSLPADVQVFVAPLLSAKVNGTPLLFKGKVRPFADPKDAVLELNIDDLDLTRYLEYLPFKPNFRVPGARLTTRLSASFQQPKDKSPALVLGGTASVKALRLTQADGKPLFKVAELAVDLGRLDLFAGRFDLARVSADGLEADVSRDRSGRLNLQRLLPPSGPAARAQAPSAPSAPASAPYLTLKELDLRNAALRFVDEAPQAALRAGVEKFDLTVRDVTADLGNKKVSVGAVDSNGASFALRHGRPEAADAAPVTPVAAAGPERKAADSAPAEAPYAVSVGRVDIRNWAVRLEDGSQAQPAITTIAPIALSMRDLSTAPGARAQLELNAAVNKGGRLKAGGSFGFAPFGADLALDVKNVDILPLQPYATQYVNLRLTQADVSTRGRLQLETGRDGVLKGGFKGDASVNNLATVDKASDNEFLRWKTLAFRAVDMRLQPFSLAVERVDLADFFARIIIDPSGHLNVQDIVRSHAGERKSLTEERAAAPASAAPAAPVAAASAPAAQPAAPLPPIRIGKLALSGGRVRFTDNFIKPNYSASLKDLGGTVAGLSSDAASNASVDLRGVVNNAPLSIAGRINPLKRDLFLDLKAEVRGMELAALSAYSDKYVGYGIEKGKLSFEVAYLLDNRKLSANNRLILDQLTFGSESTNPSATRLPVRLAVALLTDRHGVIDVNVPIGGSLDDPQFSVGGIVLRIIGNLVVKAVTAPFTLLGSLFGGGEELSTLAFDPGRAVIAPAGEAKLKSLARALTERPALKLELTGRIDPATDIEGLKLAAIERKLRALKTRDMQARGQALPEGGVTVSPDEYPALLARAYKDESFAKPRNAIGLQKSLPPDEMEKLMLANTAVGNDDLIALGNRRAQAAKEWLAKNGQVPEERMFIVAAKPAGRDEKDGKQASSFSRVDFSLR